MNHDPHPWRELLATLTTRLAMSLEYGRSRLSEAGESASLRRRMAEVQQALLGLADEIREEANAP